MSEGSQQAAPAQVDEDVSTVGEGLRVLIADDHPMARVGVRLALERGGFAVCAEAADADSAIEAAPPHLRNGPPQGRRRFKSLKPQLVSGNAPNGLACVDLSQRPRPFDLNAGSAARRLFGWKHAVS